MIRKYNKGMDSEVMTFEAVLAIRLSLCMASGTALGYSIFSIYLVT